MMKSRGKHWWFLATFITVASVDSTFDFGKWLIGRYTTISVFVSILLLVGFSFLLAGIVEVIHRRRAAQERHIEQYIHHKVKVSVHKGDIGNHWGHSLCPECKFFKPDTKENCLIETTVHTTCRLNHLVLVIWECPKFQVMSSG